MQEIWWVRDPLATPGHAYDSQTLGLPSQEVSLRPRKQILPHVEGGGRRCVDVNVRGCRLWRIGLMGGRDVEGDGVVEWTKNATVGFNSRDYRSCHGNLDACKVLRFKLVTQRFCLSVTFVMYFSLKFISYKCWSCATAWWGQNGHMPPWKLGLRTKIFRKPEINSLIGLIIAMTGMTLILYSTRARFTVLVRAGLRGGGN